MSYRTDSSQFDARSVVTTSTCAELSDIFPVESVASITTGTRFVVKHGWTAVRPGEQLSVKCGDQVEAIEWSADKEWVNGRVGAHTGWFPAAALKKSKSKVRDVSHAAVNSVALDGRKDGVLSSADAALALLGSGDRPIALVDLGHLEARLNLWKTELPMVRPHYAMKCCPDVRMVRKLAELGTGFDCATAAELTTVVSTIGVEPSRAIYAHTCKPRSHIKVARALGVQRMTFDNLHELTKISEEFPTAACVLRIVTDDANAQAPLSSKFGAHKNMWVPLLERAKALSLRVVGISFHVGSGCSSPGAFKAAIADARKCWNLALDHGFAEMHLLDIGGGFPGSNSVGVDFKKIAEEIRTALQENFADVTGLEMMAEPGRFFANGSTALLTKCTAVAEMLGADGSKQYRYYLNDGLYASFNCMVYDHQEVEMELLENHTMISGNPEQKYSSTVFGPTCDGFDTILRNAPLPAIQEGSWVLWRGMGAYTVAAGSEFNGFERPVSFYYQLR